jgi:hypothetical protein
MSCNFRRWDRDPLGRATDLLDHAAQPTPHLLSRIHGRDRRERGQADQRGSRDVQARRLGLDVLAAYISMTPETLSRLLQDQRWIDSKRARVLILDRAKLLAIADGLDIEG